MIMALDSAIRCGNEKEESVYDLRGFLAYARLSTFLSAGCMRAITKYLLSGAWLFIEPDSSM